MALYGRLLILHLIQLALVAATEATSDDQALPPQSLPGCPDRCGDHTVSYPFGVGEGCYLSEMFNLTCNESVQPPTAIWVNNTIATNISVAEGELQILQYIAFDCYNKYGNQTKNDLVELVLPPPFTISDTRNKFIAVGCDTIALFLGYRRHPSEEDDYYINGCVSICDKMDNAVNTSCLGAGVGCCQAAIPSGLINTTFELLSTGNYTLTRDSNRCSYAFMVEEDEFTFSSNTTSQELANTEKLPMILNWEIQDGGCDEAQKRPDYACKANSECVNRTIVQTKPTGYYCKCLTGFEGNPYLPDGCRDVNECKAQTKPCNNGTCNNLYGDYNCSCWKGFRNTDSKTCTPNNPTSKNKSLKIFLGVSFSFIILLVVLIGIHYGMNKRRTTKPKAKYFKANGGAMLQEQLTRHGEKVHTTRIFTAEELEEATENYHESRVLGEGSYGTVYKGTLPNNEMVAIKKPKIVARTQTIQFVNEVIFLSQINHRNVVKLLGCCFETEVPLLVYEYMVHGTLFEHLFNNKMGKSSSLSWELRLKIASETAGALAYLHSSTSTPIIHRDVKTTHILLDEDYTAKVSDFGASRFIPQDQTDVATLVQGTMGYLDPEYLQSNTLTEKSDVYSFGVVLAELLTSKMAISFARPELERSLANLFVSSIENQCLIRVLDADMVNEGNLETIEQVANLAKRCLRVKGEERPMMKEVGIELEGMRNVRGKHPLGNVEICPEQSQETQYLLSSPDFKAYTEGEGEVTFSGSASRYASLQTELLRSYNDGR